MENQEIIVVEDEESCGLILLKGLAPLGRPLKMFESGLAAWEHLRTLESCPLIVTDYGLPDLTGGELIRLVRTSSLLAQTPIIVVSGIIRLNEINAVLIGGADRFLPKPVDISLLRQYSTHLLSKPTHQPTNVM